MDEICIRERLYILDQWDKGMPLKMIFHIFERPIHVIKEIITEYESTPYIIKESKINYMKQRRKSYEFR